MVMFVLIVFVVMSVARILKPLLGSVVYFGADRAVIRLLLVMVVAIVVIVIVGLRLIMVMMVIMIIVGLHLIVVMIIMSLPQTEPLWLFFCILVNVVFVALMLSLLTVDPIFAWPSISLQSMSMTKVVSKIAAR